VLIVTVFTIFPDIIDDYCRKSLLGKALANGKWNLKIVNIRDYSNDKYRKVDDVPFGGGRGMIMKADVIGNAIENNLGSPRKTKIYYPSPRGELLSQLKISAMEKFGDIAIVCGRYEGIDQRVLEEFDIEEVSVGDFVLMGGELPALMMLEAIVRCVDGVIRLESIENDSFGAARENSYKNLLEHPLYTKPLQWRDKKVPEVLLSGHHANIENWKLRQSENITRERRPDLYEKYLEELKKLSQNTK
jgi:tRNA (guanine37-N1)-methyltransferase